MLDLQRNGENIYDPIKSRLPQIIEAFVSVYGEKHRARITNKLTGANYFCYARGGEKEHTEKLRDELYDQQQEKIIEFGAKYKFTNVNTLVEFDLESEDMLDVKGSMGRATILRIACKMAGLPNANHLLNFKKDLTPENFDKIKEQIAKMKNDPLAIEAIKLDVKIQQLNKQYDYYAVKDQNTDKTQASTDKKTEVISRLDELGIKGEIDRESVIDYAMDGYFKDVEAFVRGVIDHKSLESTILCCLPNGLKLDTWLAMHELGHVIDETVTLNNSNDNIVRKSGLDLGVEGYYYSNLEENGAISAVGNEEGRDSCPFIGKRNYELLNEVINDIITHKVAIAFEKDGNVLGNSMESIALSEHSMYTKGFDLLEEFIEKHLDVLIECKVGDTNKILETFGSAENFNALASLVSEYVWKVKSLTDEKEKENINNQMKEQLVAIENKMQVKTSLSFDR